MVCRATDTRKETENRGTQEQCPITFAPKCQNRAVKNQGGPIPTLGPEIGIGAEAPLVPRYQWQ